jgi:hypothetical protein
MPVKTILRSYYIDERCLKTYLPKVERDVIGNDPLRDYLICKPEDLKNHDKVKRLLEQMKVDQLRVLNKKKPTSTRLFDFSWSTCRQSVTDMSRRVGLANMRHMDQFQIRGGTTS